MQRKRPDQSLPWAVLNRLFPPRPLLPLLLFLLLPSFQLCVFSPTWFPSRCKDQSPDRVLVCLFGCIPGMVAPVAMGPGLEFPMAPIDRNRPVGCDLRQPSHLTAIDTASSLGTIDRSWWCYVQPSHGLIWRSPLSSKAPLHCSSQHHFTHSYIWKSNLGK